MSILESQKTQSIVGIANLAQNKQINKSIQELNKSEMEALKIAKEAAKLQKEANKLNKQKLAAQEDAAKSAEMQLKIQRQAEESRILKEKEEARAKRDLKIRKEVVFNAGQDIKTIKVSEKNPIEKFFDLNSVAFSLKELNIIASDFDEYADKEYLANIETELTQAIDVTYSSMTQEEINDLEKINKILSVNEESKISHIESKKDKEIKLLESIEKSKILVSAATSLSEIDSITAKFIKE